MSDLIGPDCPKLGGTISLNMAMYCDILGFLGNMTYTPVAFP
jgi:hypothetical protein